MEQVLPRVESNGEWWNDIVEGLPDPVVRDGMIAAIDRSGMGVDLIPERAERYLTEDDAGFFG